MARAKDTKGTAVAAKVAPAKDTSGAGSPAEPKIARTEAPGVVEQSMQIAAARAAPASRRSPSNKIRSRTADLSAAAAAVGAKPKVMIEGFGPLCCTPVFNPEARLRFRGRLNRGRVRRVSPASS